MSSVKKKRRRSSLAVNKLKIEFSPLPDAALHKSVDGSLPQDQRLEMLTRLCLQHTFQRVGRDLGSEDILDILQQGSEEVSKVLERSDVREAVHSACIKSGLQPNPDNIELEGHIQITEKNINRLHAEEEDWYRVCKQMETSASQAESQYSTFSLPASEVTEEQCAMSKSYLPCLADLEAVKQQVSDACNKAFILSKKNERTVHRLRVSQLDVTSQLDSLLAKLYDKTCRFADRDPRDMILNLMELQGLEQEVAMVDG